MNGKQARKLRRHVDYRANENVNIPLKYRYKEENRKVRIDTDALDQVYHVHTRTLVHKNSSARAYRDAKNAYKGRAGSIHA